MPEQNDPSKPYYSYEEWDETWEFTPYQMLFMGDNAKTDAAYEAIFPLIQDGQRTTSWGVSLFLMASTHDGDMHPLMYRTSDYAMNPVEGPDGKLYDRYVADPAVNGVAGQAWGGNRARPDLIRLFFPGDDAPEVQEWIEVEDVTSPFTIDELTPETTYEVQVKAFGPVEVDRLNAAGGPETDWTESTIFTTLAEDPTVGVETVRVETTGDNNYYNLMGQKVTGNLPAGIYIHNGKKIVVR